MAFLEWRKFNFFELHHNVDDGKVAEVLKDTSIKTCTSGFSQLVITDDNGWIHIFSRTWVATSFKGYEHTIFLALQMKHDPFLITIGEDETGIKSVIKVWDSSRQNNHDNPICVRVTKLSRIRSTPTALAVHDNKNLMAVGFDDGTLILFRGDISRQRSSKEIELKNKPNNTSTITGLAFKGTSHLFVASRSSVMVFTINSSGKERGLTLDDEVSGCRPNCAVLIHEQQFVVARNDAIYCYTVDGRGPCYALEGVKKRIDWFRSYLVAISKENDDKSPNTNGENSSNDHVTILDIQNKFIVFSMPLKKVKAVLTEWGSFYIITENCEVYHLDEKDLQSKLSLLFKKNLYDVAIRIANSQKYDSERLIDIYTQYGDHLFKKGDPKGAIEQYVKTIGRLETSYVIRKFLESRHLEPLIYYLQELHRLGFATEDHTTLLLTCFVKLDQHDQHGKLKEFINAKDRVIDFNIEIAIKVCRQVSSDDALCLAKEHNRHDWYLRIIIEDKKDFRNALDYISDLEFNDSNSYMKNYGNILIQNIPNETTQFLKRLCTDYKPKNKPLVDDAMMEGVVSYQIQKASPEEYIHLFLNNSEQLVDFLEYLVKYETNWSSVIYNTLIEHHLHIWSSLKDKSSLQYTYEQKLIKILQNSEANYDKDQTLIVCLMLNFKPGILYLYEEYKLYQQILRYHLAQEDTDSAMNCCRKFGAQEPHLWVEMLWNSPPPHHLPEILNVIANQRLLSPLLVIDCLANSTKFTLQHTRKYLMNILSAEENIISAETTLGEKLRTETESLRNELKDASLRPLICQASKCAACSLALELPTRHFLCNHSYHQHCIQSFSENEDECPACVPNNKKLIEVLKNQGTGTQTTEAFHAQLERADDGFPVLAEYFGRGIFNKLTIISTENKNDSTTINNSQNNLKNSIKVENTILPILENPKIISKSFDKVSDSIYNSNFQTNIAEQIEKHKKQLNDYSDKESSKNSTPNKNSPLSNKNKKNVNLDTVSAGSNSSSFKEKTIGSQLIIGDIGSYDNSKNPFADKDDEINLKGNNPFEDDDVTYDNSKNPFA